MAKSRSFTSKCSTCRDLPEQSIRAPPIWRSGYNCNSTTASSSITTATYSRRDRRKCGRRKRFCPSQSAYCASRAQSKLRRLCSRLGNYATTMDANSPATLVESAAFVSRVMLVPEENLGVVVLTNAEEGGAFDSILYHVLDSYFNYRQPTGSPRTSL